MSISHWQGVFDCRHTGLHSTRSFSTTRLQQVMWLVCFPSFESKFSWFLRLVVCVKVVFGLHHVRNDHGLSTVLCRWPPNNVQKSTALAWKFVFPARNTDFKRCQGHDNKVCQPNFAIELRELQNLSVNFHCPGFVAIMKIDTATWAK